MNLKKTRILYGGLIALFISIISLCVYYLLGGFNETSLYKAGPTNQLLLGKYFDTVHDPDFSTHGAKCRELIESGSINGRLAVMIYPVDTIRDSEIDRFVGIATNEDMAEIPSDFEIRELNLSGSVVLEIKDMHLLVQPRPDKIEKMIRDFAAEQRLQLTNYYLIYYGKDHSETIIEWPTIN